MPHGTAHTTRGNGAISFRAHVALVRGAIPQQALLAAAKSPLHPYCRPQDGRSPNVHALGLQTPLGRSQYNDVMSFMGVCNRRGERRRSSRSPA
jgi:hypothetical protein